MGCAEGGCWRWEGGGVEVVEEGLDCEHCVGKVEGSGKGGGWEGGGVGREGESC